MLSSDPRHGTNRQPHWETVKGCPCTTCERSRRYRRRIYKQNRSGQPCRIPAQLAAKHIRHLIANGWNQGDIARAAGVGQATISETLTGLRDKMLIDTAAAIMGVTGTPNTHHVPAHGTTRRLQALVALGWTAKEVCAAANLSPQFLADKLAHAQVAVSADTAAAVADVYERLSMTIPEMTPARKRSRTIALKNRWVPPLAWQNIDDPDERPTELRRTWHDGPGHDVIDEAVVERILGGDYGLAHEATTAERREVVRRWRKADPLAGQRGHAREDGQRPSLAYLGRLTGWKVERYVDRADGAA